MRSILMCAILCMVLSGLTAQSAAISPLASKVALLEQQHVEPVYFAPMYQQAWEETYAAAVEKATYVTLNGYDLNQIVQGHYAFIEMQIPVSDDVLTVQLFPSELFAAGFSVRTSATNNAIPYTANAHYRGIIKGDPESFVAISIFPDRMEGVISAPGKGNLVIAPLKGSDMHVIYDDRDLLLQNPLSCATLDHENMSRALSNVVTDAKVEALDPCVRVYIEADYEMFEDEGGATEAADFIVSFFNVVSTLYFNESISTIISEIFVWTEADPYPTSSSFDALDEFVSYRTDFNGDIAHLVTYDDENLGGVAWVDILCYEPLSYAYSNIYNYFSDFPTYSWTVEVFTHEMGHNLGSPHTQNCDWPGGAIDNCWTTEGGCPPGPAPVDGGTIMSYCHLTGYGINFANGFGPLPGDLIRDEVDGAACLDACELPPANDWPCSSIEIPVNESCVFVEGTNVGAINSVVPSVACDGESAGDVWFNLTVGPEGYVIIETDQGDVINDMGMKLYYGTCTDLSNIPGGCVPDGSPYAPLMPAFVLEAPPGSEIFIRLWEVNNDAFGDFSICAYTECVASTPPAGIVATDTILCIGESATLTLDGGVLGSLGSWNWYAGDCSGAPISNDTSITVTPDATTTYFIQAADACDTTACIALTVETAPVPETPEITLGDCVLTTEEIAGATYTWYLDGEVIADETSATLIFDTPGSYSVTITTYGNCSATSEVIVADCVQSGVMNNAEPELTVSPNPSQGIFDVSVSGYTGDLLLQLYTMTGQLLYSMSAYVSTVQHVLPVQIDLPAGMYMLQATGAGAMAVETLVIE